jgi:hypothetical protein
MEKYLLKIPAAQKDSFYDLDTLDKKQANGYDRFYLQIMQNGKQFGLCVFNIDIDAHPDKRAFIRHLSIFDPTHLLKVIEIVMNFVWANVDCQNCRVEIFHIKDPATGQMKADPDVKTAFTKNIFKWKTLTNDPVTGKRAQVM